MRESCEAGAATNRKPFNRISRGVPFGSNAEVQTERRHLEPTARAALTRCREPRFWSSRAATPDERRVRCSERGAENAALAPARRQGMSEVANSGSALPAEGRRGSVANASLPTRSSMLGPPLEDSRATLDVSWLKLPRRKTAASITGNGSANCTLPGWKSTPHEDPTPCPKRGTWRARTTRIGW